MVTIEILEQCTYGEYKKAVKIFKKEVITYGEDTEDETEGYVFRISKEGWSFVRLNNAIEIFNKILL